MKLQVSSAFNFCKDSLTKVVLKVIKIGFHGHEKWTHPSHNLVPLVCLWIFLQKKAYQWKHHCEAIKSEGKTKGHREHMEVATDGSSQWRFEVELFGFCSGMCPK